MKQTGTCPKCSSRNIIAAAKAVDRGEANIQNEKIIATFRNPDAHIMKGKQTTPVSAWVCRDCGYTEFYADRPRDLETGS